jgi:hypothetical protein
LKKIRALSLRKRREIASIFSSEFSDAHETVEGCTSGAPNDCIAWLAEIECIA